MPAMVEAGAIPGLLRHLANSAEEPLSSRQQAEIDQQSPSLLLAARLLYAFSLDPGVRCVLQFSCLAVVGMNEAVGGYSSARVSLLFDAANEGTMGSFTGDCTAVDTTLPALSPRKGRGVHKLSPGLAVVPVVVWE